MSWSCATPKYNQLILEAIVESLFLMLFFLLQQHKCSTKSSGWWKRIPCGSLGWWWRCWHGDSGTTQHFWLGGCASIPPTTHPVSALGHNGREVGYGLKSMDWLSRCEWHHAFTVVVSKSFDLSLLTAAGLVSACFPQYVQFCIIGRQIHHWGSDS